MPNHLINETSPYLLQHAHNPVNWNAWNDKTLERAKQENKMLLISVGYAACHWCHVMEHESFEDPEVAKVMNEHYICIKVDREERPDVDQVYMDAAQLINGNGGWPLNALAMPDGRPFMAGTYFPKENWIRFLEYFAGIFKNEPNKLDEQADKVSNGIRNIEMIELNKDPHSIKNEDLEEIFNHLKRSIDFEDGGTKGSIKFPMPAIWEFLLQYSYSGKNDEAVNALKITLQNMAFGGIYDQVGGGFSRYATDSKWHVPHFEKMLYDNAQLVSLYSHAYQLTKEPLYKRIVYETLRFINRELTSREGGFYSSLDADSEGEEGKYYIWSGKEIRELLGEDADFYSQFYGITSHGNWEEQKNIPDINMGNHSKEIHDFEESANQHKIRSLNNILLKEREKRIRPATDDKILTSWNALMAKGFIDAYKAFGEESFLQTAQENIDFLLKDILNDDNSIMRNYKNGKASIFGFLDDYAFLISALIDLYQVTFREEYLQKAKMITEYVQLHFYDKSSGMFFYTDDQHSKLIARKMETSDNVIPSSNSEMAKNLMKLGLFFENADMQQTSFQMVKNMKESIIKNPGYFGNWAQVLFMQIHTPFEIAITGEAAMEKLQEFEVHYLPDALFLGGKNSSLSLLEDKQAGNKTMIYVCKNKTCAMPVENVKDAIEQMKEK
ncbi:MAG: thioredoxin domain-containing protein [Ginsengibacter sp.]